VHGIDYEVRVMEIMCGEQGSAHVERDELRIEGGAGEGDAEGFADQGVCAIGGEEVCCFYCLLRGVWVGDDDGHGGGVGCAGSYGVAEFDGDFLCIKGR
jgi:hypothetical protein